jgi:hypothetical protein
VRRSVRLLAFAGVLLAFAACGCSGHSRSGKDNSSVSRRLTAAPTNCPGPKPSLKQVTPSVGPVLGQRPAWAAFYARVDPQTGALHMTADIPRTRDGWRDKVLWLVASHQKGVIRLRGRDLASGTPLKFHVQLSGVGIGPVGLLNHGIPGAVTNPGEPKQFPSYVYFPRAGCYTLGASWEGGSWRVVVGLGR